MSEESTGPSGVVNKKDKRSGFVTEKIGVNQNLVVEWNYAVLCKFMYFFSFIFVYLSNQNRQLFYSCERNFNVWTGREKIYRGACKIFTYVYIIP